jgi:hypothetical protein
MSRALPFQAGVLSVFSVPPTRHIFRFSHTSPAMTEATNPFAALSLIVAPAVLTNASSILVLSTSNRLARAVDRARGLAIQLEGDRLERHPFGDFRLRELNSAEQRALLLLRALRFFYAALGAFATAAFVFLLGAALSQTHSSGAARALELTAVFTGLLAVGCLVSGCVVLLRETKIAVEIVSEEATLLRQQLATRNRQ